MLRATRPAAARGEPQPRAHGAGGAAAQPGLQALAALLPSAHGTLARPPSIRLPLCSTGVAVFAYEDAAAQAMSCWQGSCELGARVVAAPAPQHGHHTPAPAPGLPAREASASKRKPAPKPAVVVSHVSILSRPCSSCWLRVPAPLVVWCHHRPHACSCSCYACLQVRGLSPATTSEQLAEAFGPAGDIKRLRLVLDEAGRSVGVAFITFTDVAAMQAALALGASLAVDGQQLSVAAAHRDMPGTPEQQEEQQQHEQQHEQQQQWAQLAPTSGPTMQLAAPPQPLQHSFSAGNLAATEAAASQAPLHRAGSSPALSSLDASPPPPRGSGLSSGVSGHLASFTGEASTDTLFARPLG